MMGVTRDTKDAVSQLHPWPQPFTQYSTDGNWVYVDSRKRTRMSDVLLSLPWEMKVP